MIAWPFRALHDPLQDKELPVAREQRRLAAILAADVVGYSRLMGRDENGTLARLPSIARKFWNQHSLRPPLLDSREMCVSLSRNAPPLFTLRSLALRAAAEKPLRGAILRASP